MTPRRPLGRSRTGDDDFVNHQLRLFPRPRLGLAFLTRRQGAIGKRHVVVGDPQSNPLGPFEEHIGKVNQVEWDFDFVVLQSVGRICHADGSEFPAEPFVVNVVIERDSHHGGSFTVRDPGSGPNLHVQHTHRLDVGHFNIPRTHVNFVPAEIRVDSVDRRQQHAARFGAIRRPNCHAGQSGLLFTLDRRHLSGQPIGPPLNLRLRELAQDRCGT